MRDSKDETFVVALAGSWEVKVVCHIKLVVLLLNLI